MAYGDLKDLKRRAAAYKVIRDKTFNITKNRTYEDTGSEFYNRPMKWWLERNAIGIHSTHNEGKSVFAERFIRILKN